MQNAKVVALGSAVRQSHELITLTSRVMRFLIEQHGFRSLALEGDEVASIKLDAYVQTGEGDPRAILAGARPFWRFAEILEAVHWIRERNERNPGDPVCVVNRESMRSIADSADSERRAAEITIEWQERTGHRVVYWGGLAHTANGLESGNNVGSYLRTRFGSGYVSIALTFHHGRLPSIVDSPPVDCVEAMLGAVDLEACLLEIHDNWPEPLRAWLNSRAKIRVIGPGIHELAGASLRTWFDFILHTQQITPAHSL